MLVLPEALARHLVPLRDEGLPERAAWALPELAGRLTELSAGPASALLTAAFGLVLDAQLRREPVAWLTLPGSSFFPPDVAAGGVDLEALVVVRVPDVATAARAAAQLVRSGGFGLLVLDLAGGAVPASGPVVPPALQSRLVGLCQKHDTALVFLTEKGGEAPSVGSLVSLRAEARRGKAESCDVAVLKDKRRGPGRLHVEACDGPPGLR